jgi:chromosome segregation ATPase
MNMQNIIKSMRGQAKTADQLSQALDQIDIEALEAAEEKLEAERRRVLLDGSDKDLEAIEAKIATANRDIERAYAVKAELTKRLDEAAAAATEAELTERYSSAKAKADAAAKMLAKEYPAIGRRFVDLIRAIAEADIAVDEADRYWRRQQLILRAQMLGAGLDPETIERGLNDFKREVLARIPSGFSLTPRGTA